MVESSQALLRRIRLGEDSGLELKSIRFRGDRVSEPRRESMADELAAMANTADGVFLLGVNDSREIEGIPIEHLDRVEAFLREICMDSIDPPLFVAIQRLELPDSLGELCAIIKVDVRRSLFVHKSPGGYFQRLGSSKKELSPELLARLFQQRSQSRLIRFEEQPVPESSPDDLEDPLWKRFVLDDALDPWLTLQKLRLVAPDSQEVERPTVAGILMCCENPQKWLPGAFVEAVCYRGIRQDSNYQIDERSITGPLDRQIEETLAFVRKNMKTAAVKNPARQELPQFSERAVFEAVVNAAAHRDYSIHGSKIRLFLFDDRLELYSPGTLPNTVTVDSIHLRQATRNELLTTLLNKCPVRYGERVGRRYYMEKRGDGVPIIIEECLRLSGKRPTYQVLDESEVRLIIPASHPFR